MVPYGYIPQEDLESEARRIRLPSHVLPAIITPALSGTGFPAVPLVAETQYRDSDQRRLPYRSEAQPNTMSAVKRTVADTEEEAVSSSKHSKKENPEDFSNAVKKRLQSSSRTGQACDRCKVRKIRCDALPGGCSPCLQSNTECRTTDRTTGATRKRGYPEQLEEQNRSLQLRVQELEQRLLQAAGDSRLSNGYRNASVSSYEAQGISNVKTWSASVDNITTPSDDRSLPTFRAGNNGDSSYLGVSLGNSNLSSIKGTALSILGMEIDIADFESVDMDEPEPSLLHTQLYNKSYQAFLQTALNINPRLDRVELPPREEGFMYAQWYFRVVSPYHPLLHRPSFFKLLTQMYDDETFQPVASEIVIVHMVFAIMFFQYASRNWEDPVQQRNLNERSNLHYHYALSYFYQLSVSHQIQDVQALTLICNHLRNFPKPGASWMLTQLTMSLAIELGLHRSVKKWAAEIRPNPLDVEMRKRTFWCLLSLQVALSGRLGRPMAINYEDFDVEMPDPIDDALLSANGLDTSKTGTCLHRIGLAAFRIVPLYLEMYNTIHAVRRDSADYLSRVNRLETKLQAWKESLPADISNPGKGANEQEERVFALFAQMWALEFRLLLRHPSVAATADAAFNAESMRICVESSRQMLGVVRQLQKFKSLDTTWYQAAVYVLAITTTLFAQWDKRNETSAADLAALRVEMDIWLEIMGDVGIFLGSGTRLREAVRVVTDGTLGLIARNIPSKPSFSSMDGPHPPRLPPPPIFTSSQQSYTVPTTSPNSYIPESRQTHRQDSYPPVTQYRTYTDTTPTQALGYTPSTTYPTYPQLTAKFETNDNLAAPLTSYSPQRPVSDSSNTSHYPGQQPTASSSWQQYTTAMVGNLELQDCYSASALMQLQGAAQQQQQQNTEVAVSAQEAQWPLIMFDVNQGT